MSGKLAGVGSKVRLLPKEATGEWRVLRDKVATVTGHDDSPREGTYYELDWGSDDLNEEFEGLPADVFEEIKKQPPKPKGTLTTDGLKKLLESVVTANLKDATSALHKAIATGDHLKVPELLAEPWHKKNSWRRESKRKDRSTKNVTRVFSCGIFEATITSDPQDTSVLDVIVQVGPAWDEAGQPPSVELVLS